MKRWVIVSWVSVILAAVGLEAFVLLDGDPTTPPLTDVVIAFVPEVLGVAFFGWAFLHFTKRYWKD